MTIKIRDFTFEGRKLTVKAEPLHDGWKVSVLENGEPAHGFAYSVSHEILQDAALTAVPGNMVEQLMDIAQSDIEEGRVKLSNKASSA